MATNVSSLKGRAPFSRAQQSLIFAKAAEGVPWAVKKIADDKTMRVQPKGAPPPHPLNKYDAAKERVIRKGRKKVRRRG